MHADGGLPAFAWDRDEIRRAGYRVVDLIADHIADLPAQPAFRPVPTALATALVEAALPRDGMSVDLVLDSFANVVGKHPFGNGHPRYYGWVNSPPAIIGVLAEAFAATVNASVAGGNHAAVWIERQVLDWVKQMLGFPREAMGLFVSGGSMAALTALAVARHVACAKNGLDVRSVGLQSATRLRLYKSAEGHGCNQKAVELLGIGSANIVTVPSDAALRIRADALDELLTRDIAAGDTPLAVVATAGTVNTGAIDPLDSIADVCARHGVWLHVDGAYGAPAILTPQYQAPLAAISRADSLAIDPHKWLYVPVDAGVILIRSASAMRDAFSLVPPYLRTDGNVAGVQGPTWFSEYGFEQTRPFRALKTWASLAHFGTSGYAALLQHDIAMALHLAELLRKDDAFQLWEPQSLSIVCFRAVPRHLRGNEPALEALNRSVLNEVQLGGEGFLSSTVIDGKFWLRACVVNPRAKEPDVDAVFHAVQAAVRKATVGGHSPHPSRPTPG